MCNSVNVLYVFPSLICKTEFDRPSEVDLLCLLECQIWHRVDYLRWHVPFLLSGRIRGAFNCRHTCKLQLLGE